MLEQSGDTLNKKHQNLVKMEVLKHLNIPLKTAFFHRERGPRLYFMEKIPENCHVGDPKYLSYKKAKFAFKLHNFKNSFKHKRSINGLYSRR